MNPFREARRIVALTLLGPGLLLVLGVTLTTVDVVEGRMPYQVPGREVIVYPTR